ncbi:hypothetical protein [Streptosporangium sp. NPDC049376]|uniref:hypothetical protein n=1 Tax=Streptosporangium sp. NPDC049376 TaxID=3366192 RepID=UPI0037934A1E
MTEETSSWRFASPLSLVNDWRDRADQASLRELVLFGFTVDLPFLEQVVVPTARVLGARITVLGDAGQGMYDPIDVRLAGSSYLHSLVSCTGAFHPKLALLIGEEDVWMAVGSGNPTLSGWGANDELWTVVASDDGGVHPAIAQAGEWLYRLATTPEVKMAPWCAELLWHIATDLTGRPITDGMTEVRLLDNLDLAFFDQLPRGPVDELCLYAPFIDPTGEAVRRLIERFEPRETILAVQPRWTSYDGSALLNALAGHTVRLRLLSETHLRHGKLIQWRVGDRRLGLVGSPNLSRGALMRSTTEGGNCELAVLSPLSKDLMPSGESASRETMTGRSTIRPSRSSPSLVLLGALVHSNGLEVTLARPQSVDVRIDSSPDGSPQSWRAVGVIPAGEVALLLTVPEAPGSVIRAVMHRAGIGAVESPPVFAVSPARCAPRVAGEQEPRLRREYTVEELFTDPVLARRFTADLVQLVEVLPRGVRVRSEAGSGDGVAVGSSIEDRWTAHLEECRRILGTSFTRLIYGLGAFGLPDSSRLSLWNHVSSVKDEGEEEDDPQEGADAPGEVESADRHLYRQWAMRWVDAVTRKDAELPPLLTRMLIAGIYIKLLAAGLWRLSDDSWREPLGRLAQALVPHDGDNVPVESRGRLCAVTATCAALLCQDVFLTGGRPNDLLAARVWATVKPLIAEADPELAEDMLLPPVQPRARVVSAGSLRRLIELAATDDPLAEMRAEIDAAGWEVTEEGGVWEITGSFSNPTLVAARLATEIGKSGKPAVVLARAGTKQTLIVWRSPELVLLSDPGRTWRVYNITASFSPESRFASADIGSVPGLIGKPRGVYLAPSAEVNRVISSCGFETVALRDLVLRGRTHDDAPEGGNVPLKSLNRRSNGGASR